MSHKPACVIAHVDVGTAALGQGLHNASSGRAPVVIFAGVAPSTLLGEAPGSRSEHVQWYQDIRDQAYHSFRRGNFVNVLGQCVLIIDMYPVCHYCFRNYSGLQMRRQADFKILQRTCYHELGTFFQTSFFSN